jgi:nicotinamidase-related amidase
VRDPLADHLLRTENAALLVIDYQSSQLAGVRSMDHALLVKNAVSTVRTIKTFGVPVVHSTINVASGRGKPTLPELADLLTDDKPLDRTTTNSWEDIEFVQAVHATGRRKLIICALWTEICMAFTALDALREGYEVYPVVDAIGGTSPEAHRAGLDRVIQAGGQPIRWVSLAVELQRDWARQDTVASDHRDRPHRSPSEGGIAPPPSPGSQGRREAPVRSHYRERGVSLMSDATSISSAWDRRRWLILGVIGLAQLMVVLDLTVMNIALPSAQGALHFTTVDRQWVVTAYTLAFGSLLLLGGRLADLLGRKVTFLAGLAGFAGVSAVGGASVNFAMLITARACQGAELQNDLVAGGDGDGDRRDGPIDVRFRRVEGRPVLAAHGDAGGDDRAGGGEADADHDEVVGRRTARHGRHGERGTGRRITVRVGRAGQPADIVRRVRNRERPQGGRQPIGRSEDDEERGCGDGR